MVCGLEWLLFLLVNYLYSLVEFHRTQFLGPCLMMYHRWLQALALLMFADDMIIQNYSDYILLQFDKIINFNLVC